MSRRRAGMTLVELIVALVIAGAAIASGYQAYATLSDHRSVAAARADSIGRAFALRATLANWLTNARLTTEEDEVVFRSVDRPSRLGRDDRPTADLVFLTSADSPVSSHGTVVHLFIARDSEGTGLTAELSEWRGRRSARLQLEPSIDGMSVEFSSSLNGRSEWTSSWVSSTLLPPFARLTFWPRHSDSLAPLLRLPLVVRLDARAGDGQ